jgi:hypothetical protein
MNKILVQCQFSFFGHLGSQCAPTTCMGRLLGYEVALIAGNMSV